MRTGQLFANFFIGLLTFMVASSYADEIDDFIACQEDLCQDVISEGVTRWSIILDASKTFVPDTPSESQREKIVSDLLILANLVSTVLKARSDFNVPLYFGYFDSEVIYDRFTCARPLECTREDLDEFIALILADRVERGLHRARMTDFRSLLTGATPLSMSGDSRGMIVFTDGISEPGSRVTRLADDMPGVGCDRHQSVASLLLALEPSELPRKSKFYFVLGEGASGFCKNVATDWNNEFVRYIPAKFGDKLDFKLYSVAKSYEAAGLPNLAELHHDLENDIAVRFPELFMCLSGVSDATKGLPLVCESLLKRSFERVVGRSPTSLELHLPRVTANSDQVFQRGRVEILFIGTTPRACDLQSGLSDFRWYSENLQSTGQSFHTIQGQDLLASRRDMCVLRGYLGGEQNVSLPSSILIARRVSGTVQQLALALNFRCLTRREEIRREIWGDQGRFWAMLAVLAAVVGIWFVYKCCNREVQVVVSEVFSKLAHSRDWGRWYVADVGGSGIRLHISQSNNNQDGLAASLESRIVVSFEPRGRGDAPKVSELVEPSGCSVRKATVDLLLVGARPVLVIWDRASFYREVDFFVRPILFERQRTETFIGDNERGSLTLFWPSLAVDKKFRRWVEDAWIPGDARTFEVEATGKCSGGSQIEAPWFRLRFVLQSRGFGLLESIVAEAALWSSLLFAIVSLGSIGGEGLLEDRALTGLFLILGSILGLLRLIESKSFNGSVAWRFSGFLNFVRFARPVGMIAGAAVVIAVLGSWLEFTTRSLVLWFFLVFAMFVVGRALLNHYVVVRIRDGKGFDNDEVFLEVLSVMLYGRY